MVTEEQHGFVKGRTTATHLLEVLDEWTETVAEGGSVDAIYMDFKKAFDTVPHTRLLGKIEAFGIKGNLLRWIRGFLTGRKQQVCVNGTTSETTHVVSGIPQGSVLGPVLFVMYINDLPGCVSKANTVKLFADDTKLFTRSDNVGATEKLQEDLGRLENWSKNWQLHFHPDKCSVLRLGNKKSDASYFMHREKP